MNCSQPDPFVSFRPEQRILVTGASSGIGAAIALRCNALGATVIANGRNGERLAAVKARATVPERFHPAIRDLTEDMDALPLWVTALRKRYGKFTGLVPCAGVGLVAPLITYTRRQANELFDIHFHAPMLLAKGFCDRRNNIGNGSSIVFMGSCAALARVAGQSIYGSAKGALMTAAVILSKEYALQGIRVNVLAPALVRTPMGEAYLDFITPEAKTEECRLYPLGLGEPEDVASMAADLLSSRTRWITGQTIVMDGGRY